MTDDEFEKVTKVVLESISESVDNQEKDFQSCWREFATHKYVFDRQKKEIAAFASINK